MFSANVVNNSQNLLFAFKIYCFVYLFYYLCPLNPQPAGVIEITLPGGRTLNYIHLRANESEFNN